MRALAIVAVVAAGFAASLPSLAPAAELELPQDRCARGQAWNGYRCEWVRPRVSEAPRVYEAPPAYVAREVEVYEEPPVYVARRYYVAPPVYVAPIYRPPVVVRYYSGPRYGWRHGGPHHGGRHYAWRR
jgi:hypothetical protein